MSRRIDVSAASMEGKALAREAASEAGKLLITGFEKHICMFYLKGGRLLEMTSLGISSGRDSGERDGGYHVGDLFLARVTNVSNELKAAFVLYGTEGASLTGFLPFSQIPADVHPKQGDLICVRLKAEPQRGKRASFSAKIDWSRIPDGESVRATASHDNKIRRLLISDGPDLKPVIKAVADTKHFEVEEIVTDLEDLFEKCSAEISGIPVRRYTDEVLSLSALYSLGTKGQEALARKVWLPSGGYLIFDYTEALTVIDVNSGKKEKSGAGFVSDLNREAAREVALQIRLRNLSGMILVDFINNEEENASESLLSYMQDLLKADTGLARALDITALGIMEITRRKTRKSLCEQFTEA
ncbi:MAG: ribonuclease E/G [Lachnospiraceae bacterium]|nr:ribonuclease E/G [Lachnospiraceae bacterium]